jgi:starch synthase/alpha-amylase
MLSQLNSEEHTKVGREISSNYGFSVVSSHKPRILLCTPEITELPEGMGNMANLIAAKGGGMGDISAGLIRSLNESNEYELHIALPKYDTPIRQLTAFTNQQLDMLAVVLSGRGIHLVNDSAFSYIDTPYAENSIHTPVRRSLVYQRHVINNLLDFINPDIVHCNDWMTGLIPAAARAKGIKSLFTLHNIFTEKQTLIEIELSGIRPVDFLEWLYFETFPGNIRKTWPIQFKTNKVDFTCSAVFAADYFNTVSKTFLEELRQHHFEEIVPEQLYTVIKDKYAAGRAVGILNAPNDTVNPKVMPHIINFNRHTLVEMKAKNKALFQKKMHLLEEPDVPLFFWPSRLYFQKGPDVLIACAEYLTRKHTMQIAVVASGDSEYERELLHLSRGNRRIGFRPFNEALSNLGKAGADFILMPSRYEPCGLPQMEGLRFATLPIVRATGGLKDTVTQLNVDRNTGNGFVFDQLDHAGFEFGISSALAFYALPRPVRTAQLQRIMSNAKRQFNLRNTARKYMNLYDRMMKEKGDEPRRTELMYHI